MIALEKDMDRGALIDLRNVSLCRGKKKILTDINWKTHRGEHWFLMGNNGSGKTTLMEIIMGYLWPQEGHVSVLGKHFGDVYLQELRANIGYVSPWVFEHIREYIPVEHVIASGTDASVGYFDNLMKPIEKKIDRLLTFFHCPELRSRPFGTLSTGQQFKVMLARALVNEPRIIILDEPFSLLDVGSRIQMYQYIETICRSEEGPQVIIVTHHFDDLIPVFTHGLFLKEGTIYQKGTREHVLRREVLSGVFGISAELLPENFVHREHIP